MDLRFEGDLSLWAGIALGVVLAIAVALLYRREVHKRGRAGVLLPVLRTGTPDPADGSPKGFKGLAGAFATAFRETFGENGRVHGTRARCADPLDGQAIVFQEAIEHAPGVGTVRAATLERQIDGLRANLLPGRAHGCAPDGSGTVTAAAALSVSEPVMSRVPCWNVIYAQIQVIRTATRLRAPIRK